jgi:hypothetical protein
MSLGRRTILQKVYEQIRDSADAWVKNGEPFYEDAAFNGSNLNKHSNFWVRLSRPGKIKSVVFMEAAERWLLHLQDEGLIGGMLPINVKVTRDKNQYDIEGNDDKLSESKEQLLFHLLNEIVKGFQLAEESVYQDQGKRPPYSLKIRQGGDRMAIIITPEKSGLGVSFSLAQARLREYIVEFFDDHILSLKFTHVQTAGKAEFIFMNHLKEELSPNDFALKIAHTLVKCIEAELKRKGAVNCAKLKVDQFNNGIPRITATLTNRSQLTHAAVERAMKDVVAEQLPDDNLLGLAAKFGGMGIAQGSNRIMLAIKPV